MCQIFSRFWNGTVGTRTRRTSKALHIFEYTSRRRRLTRPRARFNPKFRNEKVACRRGVVASWQRRGQDCNHVGIGLSPRVNACSARLRQRPRIPWDLFKPLSVPDIFATRLLNVKYTDARVNCLKRREASLSVCLRTQCVFDTWYIIFSPERERERERGGGN